MSDHAVAGKIGVVDIGSNSVKLLVLDGDDVLHRDSVVTRLGTGVADTGVLAEDSIDTTIRRLNEIRTILDTHRVTDAHAVATAAVRAANNSAPFIQAAQRALGFDVNVIDGITEGSLAFIGAQRNLGHVIGQDPITVVDIGGGSTEFSIGAPGTTPRVVSIPFGARNLTERQLAHDPPRPEELTNAIGAVIDEVDDVVREIPELESCDHLVGVAGTIVTIAMVELGLHRFDAEILHGMQLTKDAAEDVFRTLATERLADRIANPGLAPERADIIVGGCCVLVGIMRRLKLDALTVSTHNLLDGLIADARREVGS